MKLISQNPANLKILTELAKRGNLRSAVKWLDTVVSPYQKTAAQLMIDGKSTAVLTSMGSLLKKQKNKIT